MNRRDRRQLVRDTTNNTLNKWGLVVNGKHITAILLQRLEVVLKEYGISYYVTNNEIKSDDTRLEGIYNSEAEKLLNELKLLKGDYKKLKLYDTGKL